MYIKKSFVIYCIELTIKSLSANQWIAQVQWREQRPFLSLLDLAVVPCYSAAEARQAGAGGDCGFLCQSRGARIDQTSIVWWPRANIANGHPSALSDGVMLHAVRSRVCGGSLPEGHQGMSLRMDYTNYWLSYRYLEVILVSSLSSSGKCYLLFCFIHDANMKIM